MGNKKSISIQYTNISYDQSNFHHVLILVFKYSHCLKASRIYVTPNHTKSIRSYDPIVVFWIGT